MFGRFSPSPLPVKETDFVQMLMRLNVFGTTFPEDFFLSLT